MTESSMPAWRNHPLSFHAPSRSIEPQPRWLAERPESAAVVAERLYFRSLGMADCTDTYVRWLNDPEVCCYLETRHSPQTSDTIREFVCAVNSRKNEWLLGIFLKMDDRHIGNIKVGPINPYHSTGEVSLFIGERDCWGLGYGSEAIAAVSRHAFAAFSVRRLTAGMYAANKRSLRAFLKCGYHVEGRRRRHYLLDGEPCDIIELGLERTGGLRPPGHASQQAGSRRTGAGPYGGEFHRD